MPATESRPRRNGYRHRRTPKCLRIGLAIGQASTDSFSAHAATRTDGTSGDDPPRLAFSPGGDWVSRNFTPGRFHAARSRRYGGRCELGQMEESLLS